MDLEFSSLKDLYLRVEPALNAKKTELDRIGLSYIDKKDEETKNMPNLEVIKKPDNIKKDKYYLTPLK